mgnify:CR=1 FL=1
MSLLQRVFFGNLGSFWCGLLSGFLLQRAFKKFEKVDLRVRFFLDPDNSEKGGGGFCGRGVSGVGLGVSPVGGRLFVGLDFLEKREGLA